LDPGIFREKGRVSNMVAKVPGRMVYMLLLTILMAFSAQAIFGQDDLQNIKRPRFATKAAATRTIPDGAKVKVVGNVTKVENGTFTVCDLKGEETVVVLTKSTVIKTHRRGIFRGAKASDTSAISLGLNVQVKGRGNEAGELVAREVEFHHSDFRSLTQVDARVAPIEAEQEFMGVKLDETSLLADSASKEAKAAQGSADRAQGSADRAQNTADLAKSEAGTAHNYAVLANERIVALDDYEVADALMVNFKVNSAVLSTEAKAKLNEFAEKSGGVKGYIIEISAFTDSTGGLDYNHRLSQRRAEVVMDYLIGVCHVPQRRIINTYSGGEINPVADNSTRDGRAQNRRTEVKLLISSGLAAKEKVANSN
jgi:outer membrane protein OmpA-like peptidoglycan-associated protein